MGHVRRCYCCTHPPSRGGWVGLGPTPEGAALTIQYICYTYAHFSATPRPRPRPHPRPVPTVLYQDKRLEELVTAASGRDIDWDYISGVLQNGRNGSQCCSRWQKVLHPQTIKGAWSTEVRACDSYVMSHLLLLYRRAACCCSILEVVVAAADGCGVCAGGLVGTPGRVGVEPTALRVLLLAWLGGAGRSSLVSSFRPACDDQKVCLVSREFL